jgi:hypothetical protein
MFRDTPIEIAATWLPSVKLCGVLALSDVCLSSSLMEHLDGDRFQNVAAMLNAGSRRFSSQSSKFYAEGTCTDKHVTNVQDFMVII